MRAPECAIHALEGLIRAPRSAIARQSSLFPSGVPDPHVAGRNLGAGVFYPKVAVHDRRVGSAQLVLRNAQSAHCAVKSGHRSAQCARRSAQSTPWTPQSDAGLLAPAMLNLHAVSTIRALECAIQRPQCAILVSEARNLPSRMRNLRAGARNLRTGVRNACAGVRNASVGGSSPCAGVRNRTPERAICIRGAQSACGWTQSGRWSALSKGRMQCAIGASEVRNLCFAMRRLRAAA